MRKIARSLALVLPLAAADPALAEDAQPPAGGTPALNEDLFNEFTGVGAHIRQSGSGNTATILQQGGAGNFAFSATDGKDNTITILQSGENHVAGVTAISNQARVTVDQAGSGHRAGVVAEGDGANIAIVQRGADESIVVRQTGPGQAIAITQGF